MAFDIKKIRSDFPILSTEVNGKQLVYFDNAATSQKPQVMIDALVNYYSKTNANIHRGVHTLSQKATEEYEATRALIAEIYNADLEEVIFTKSDTESLNLLAYSLPKSINLVSKNIVITEMEHHSNIVPWQLQTSESKNLRYVEFTRDGLIDFDDLKEKVDANTAIFSFTWASNTFGNINDAKEIINLVRSINPETIIIIDAAQYVPHRLFNFKALDVDFITFSSHKLFGPTGVGVLIGKKSRLTEMQPFLAGGDMIKEVSKELTTFNDLPYKFEAGTPNIADVIALKSSLGYLLNLGFENIEAYENELTEYLFERMSELDFITIYGPVPTLQLSNPTTRQHQASKLPLISFNITDVHPHDAGTILDEEGIAVRTGHHCTQLIMKRLEIPASIRASLAFYNTKEEIDIFIEGLKKVYNIFNNA
jgi:cysteine desulfurase/selenocysteine lyase